MRKLWSFRWRCCALFIALFRLSSTHATVQCNSTKICWEMIHKRSECVAGVCTNPFYYGGCLNQMIPSNTKLRTCSSDDPIDAEENGFCKKSAMNYPEVRIHAQNWESSFFEAWIMQILLSELLDVPVSIEAGTAEANINLYHKFSALDYGVANGFDAIETAFETKDCRRLLSNNNEYVPCAHVIPEVWSLAKWSIAEQLDKGTILPPTALGALGDSGIYVPLGTVERDPSLLSYVGLRGEENRRKVAEAFKLPTSWNEYCSIISQDNCTSADSVAAGPPPDQTQGSKYFVEGSFTGFFRETDDSNCDLHPTTCHGYLLDWPCDWNSYAFQLLHHQKIALKPIQFSYAHHVQIQKAAFHTGSNFINVWWTPTFQFEEYIGTHNEFTKVSFPPPTERCYGARADPLQRCASEVDFGSPEGACGDQPEILSKVISTSLQDSAIDPSIPSAIQSPAYDAIRSFKIDQSKLGEIFQIWLDRNKDKWNYDPREATCRWVVENLEELQSFVPLSHPRILVESQIMEDSASRVCAAIAILTIFLVAGTGYQTHRRRNRKMIVDMNVGFLFLYLLGLLLVSSSGLLLVMATTDGICTTTTWFSTIGYSLLFPLLAAKVDAINRLISGGNHMKRAVLKNIGRNVAAPAVLSVTLFLVAWTVVDAPGKKMKVENTDMTTENGEHIIDATGYCSSTSRIWESCNFGWQGLTLLYTAFLAMMISRVKEDMNDTRSLARVSSSHFAFFILRFTLYLLQTGSGLDTARTSQIESFALSFETLGAIVILFLPKLFRNCDDQEDDQPRPDFFLETSILMADLVNFTKWSSMREPDQVFRMLEYLYEQFDQLGEKRGVFKVETVGDCYVAAVGIPKARPDHAVVAAEYAAECMNAIHDTVKKIEVDFGPGTGDLTMRIGIHSGSVTGGFLRGKCARFQLFGDTMNMASRMESMGCARCVQVSENTASLLQAAGKGKWLERRKEPIHVKGKGRQQTFWLVHSGLKAAPEVDVQVENMDNSPDQIDRLVVWSVKVLENAIKDIVACRQARSLDTRASPITAESSRDTKDNNVGVKSVIRYSENSQRPETGAPIAEITEVIVLPEFCRKQAARRRSSSHIDISIRIHDQLHEFVVAVSRMYRANPFHNFAHAGQVIMAVSKQMNRIIAPADLEMEESGVKSAGVLHDNTYGITSDPLTQFSCLFAALIHDIDHPGVPNTRLIVENETLAQRYGDRSVAEQNSLDIAWELLKEHRFRDLRKTICETPAEMTRFRQLLVNCVMATDIIDEELKVLRNERWQKAFSEASIHQHREGKELTDRKATIVIEHLIQASDVAHTMQHWHVYRKWNENLFREMFVAFRMGRFDTNPADFWYEGEIGFFDHYVIPLSRKLRDCGVFGVSSDENLMYARQNREEWISRGREIVAEMIERVEVEYQQLPAPVVLLKESEVAQSNEDGQHIIDKTECTTRTPNISVFKNNHTRAARSA